MKGGSFMACSASHTRSTLSWQYLAKTLTHQPAVMHMPSSHAHSMTLNAAFVALLAVLLCCSSSVGAQQAAGALPATTAADPTVRFAGEVAFAAPPVNETLANATLGCDSPCYVVKDYYPFKTCKPECNAQTCSRGEAANLRWLAREQQPASSYEACQPLPYPRMPPLRLAFCVGTLVEGASPWHMLHSTLTQPAITLLPQTYHLTMSCPHSATPPPRPPPFRPTTPGFGVWASQELCCAPGLAFPDGCSARPSECWVAENPSLRTCVRDDRKCLAGEGGEKEGLAVAGRGGGAEKGPAVAGREAAQERGHMGPCSLGGTRAGCTHADAHMDAHCDQPAASW